MVLPLMPFEPTTALLLIDHGSRRAEAHTQLLEIAERLSEKLATLGSASPLVEIAHMEIAEPNIAAGFEACVRRGATRVVAIPCLLSRGRHVTEDIPALLAEAALQFPEVSYALSAPLSEHEGFLDLLVAASRSV
jgi:sirohydrochlorin ferrochelatase